MRAPSQPPDSAPRAAGPPPDIPAASIPATLAALHVNPDAGLASAEVLIRRTTHGYNEVVETKQHPLRTFLAKFWGVSAWMLELIIGLSAVLGKYSDLVVEAAARRQRRAGFHPGAPGSRRR